jgi:ribosomal protein L37E
MVEQQQQCGHCGRKAFRSPTNRCMYCGKPLPDSLKLNEEELVAFKQQQDAASEQSRTFATGMQARGFDLQPEPRKRTSRKKGLIRRMGAFLLEALSGTRGN